MARLALADQILFLIIVERLDRGRCTQRPIRHIANVLSVAGLCKNLHLIVVVKVADIKVGALCCWSKLVTSDDEEDISSQLSEEFVKPSVLEWNCNFEQKSKTAPAD